MCVSVGVYQKGCASVANNDLTDEVGQREETKTGSELLIGFNSSAEW